MRLCRLLVLSLGLVSGGGAANAELKDFQIARLILTRSECILKGQLIRTEQSDGSWSYHGDCSYETFYPDGIDVLCPDPDDNDERACTILTRKKEFLYLELLRRHGNDF